MPKMSSFATKVLSAVGNRQTMLVEFLDRFDNPDVYPTPNINGDGYGTYVGTDGNYCVVGAPSEGSAAGGSVGVVYIWDLSTETLLHTLNSPTGTPLDGFGFSVAMSGNYAFIGSALYNNGGNSGRLYIYNVVSGSLVKTIENPNAYGSTAGDKFGREIAASGNYVIVGVQEEDDAGGTDSGKAYIFKTTNGTWSDASLVYTLNNPNPYGTSAYDSFGEAVAISGNYAIVGAGSEDNDNGIFGRAYIYNVTNGSLVYTLTDPDTGALSNFGTAVDIRGNYAIVGRPSAGGKAYIFKTDNGTWSDTALYQTLDNPNDYSDDADSFGIKVALTDRHAVVSASSEAEVGYTYVGKIYIFDKNSGGRTQTISNPTVSTFDQFGKDISAGSNYLVIGSSYNPALHAYRILK